MLSNNLKLALNYYRTKNCSRVLNLSREIIPFPNSYIEYYVRQTPKGLPFDDKSFDFIYTTDKTLSEIFKSPAQMIAELSRVSKKGGWIETQSPITTILYDRCPHLGSVTWTDYHTNTLCFLPYEGKLSTDLPKKDEWQKLLFANNIYLKNFFTWTSPLELNFLIYSYECKLEYDLILADALYNSTQYTKYLLEIYDDNKLWS